MVIGNASDVLKEGEDALFMLEVRMNARTPDQSPRTKASNTLLANTAISTAEERERLQQHRSPTTNTKLKISSFLHRRTVSSLRINGL